MKITISDYTPPSLNVILRMSYWKRRKLQKQWDDFIIGYAWSAGWRRDKQYSRADITLYFPDKRRRDEDNYIGSKVIPDALKHNGLIIDDNMNDFKAEWHFEIGERKTVIGLR